MVMGQEYMPQHIGMAFGPRRSACRSALGGIAAVILGAVADAVDLETTLWLCAVAPLAGLVLTLLLPPTRARRVLAPEIASP